MSQPTASRWIETNVVNRFIKFAVRLGIAPGLFALIETTGRRSGLARRTPVGGWRDGDVYWLVAMRSSSSDYVANLLANPVVRLKLGRRWWVGTATPCHDDDALARREAINKAHGIVGRFDGKVFRSGAEDPLTIRIDLKGLAGAS